MQKLKLEVPAGFAMDYLNILHVKAMKTNSDESWKNFYRCYFYLYEQSIDNHFLKAFDSPEYLELLGVNKKIFELVDLIKVENTDARVVDAENYHRAQIKKVIQDKYFGGGEVEEKLGYNKE
jgi:hypothetical protein